MHARQLLFPLFASCLAASPASGQSFEGIHDVPHDPLDHQLAPDSIAQDDMEASEGLRSFEGLSIRELLTEPLVDTDESGRVWVRTRDLRASLGESGLTVYPVFGAQSPREWPVRFEVSATRGDELLPAGATGTPIRRTGQLELTRASMREVYHLGADGIEQTFVFEELSGDGDLVVRLDIETELTVTDEGDVLRFSHDSFGSMTYGGAFVHDAAGTCQPIERVWTGDAIELRVPAEFLDGAVLPVTIDPPMNGFTSDFGVADDRQPDIVYAGQPNRYLVCWQEWTSGSNSDVYVTWFSKAGATQGPAVAIEQGDDDWRYPRIAYAYGPDRAMIVASVDLNSGMSRVKGRILDATAMTVEGNSFLVSFEGNNKGGVDVGGTPHTGMTNAYFNVVWSQYVGPGDAKVRYRTMDWDGSPITPIRDLTNYSDGAVQSTISNSLGDLSEGPDYWTVAWIQDTDGDGRGQVWAQRVRWDGDKDSGGGKFQVDGSSSCARPSATSSFDGVLDDNNERPSIVAYDKRYNAPDHPNGFQHSVHARVVTFGEAHALISINSTLEDFDPDLDQYGASIATDGRNFTLSYNEESWTNIGSTNHDMYMVSGNIIERPNFVGLALSERHQLLANTIHPERQGRVCTIWDGEASTDDDDGAIIWVRETSAHAGYGLIAGSTFDNPTDYATGEMAVGGQYCNAYPNSVGTYGGRNSSWLWVRGEGFLDELHTAIALDLPTHSFGYLAVAPQSGSVNFPGGSAGKLCLGGAIGRYTSQVQSSGIEGVIETVVDPLALPSPTGPVAAQPGESWYFQLWHRDKVNGQQTSNFTNACRVAFEL